MKQILYLGLEPPALIQGIRWIHYPMIEIMPRKNEELKEPFERLAEATHLVITSQKAAILLKKTALFFNYPLSDLLKKKCFSVGKTTTQTLLLLGFTEPLTASCEQQEGVLDLIEQHTNLYDHLFYAHSSLARPFLADSIRKKNLRLTDCVLYDTQYIRPPYDLPTADAIYFTSTSTVNSYFHFFPTIPAATHCIAKGHITKKALQERGYISTLWESITKELS